ncbi:MAG: hypothetical protein H6704_20795 [Myxococcales bacterium]|nr:hypothetical protein [Myxococcales bacterium]
MSRARRAAWVPLSLLVVGLLGCDTTWPWATSPSGRAGLRALWADAGHTSTWRAVPIVGSPEADMVVLTPTARLHPDEVRALARFASAGGTVVMLGGADFANGRSRPWCPDRSEGPAAPGLARYREGSVHLPRRSTLDEVPQFGGHALITWPDGSLYATEQIVGDGSFICFADDALFTNVALAWDDNVAFQGWFLPEPSRIELIDRNTDDPTPTTALGAAATPEMLPLSLHLLLLFVVVALARGARFGAPRQRAEDSRQAFAEHVRALGGLYARAQMASHALHVYAAWALEHLRARYGRDLELDVLAARVADRTGRARAEVTDLLRSAAAAAAARPADADDAPHAALASGATLERLAALMDETTRGAR